MDRKRFDALARMLSTPGSRRAALGALLGVSLLGQDPGVLAKRDEGGKSKGKDSGHDGPGVQGEGRPGAARKAHHKRQQTQRQRRKKRNRQDPNGGQNAKPCCGTKQCAPPEPGSTRSECDFEEQSFAGQDLQGSIFRGIDGRRANFDSTDSRGSDFAGACLFLATFRGAKLADATWGEACLFAADFTDADLGDPDALAGAVHCGTIMPDGTRNDRDCGRLPRCCQPAQGGGGGGEGCESCAATDRCHVAGSCVCTCTTPTAPNGTSCTDGNPLCIAGVCCADGHKAIHGGCFKIGGPMGQGCNRNTCDGFIADCAPFAGDCSTNLCVQVTSTECHEHADCPPGQACNRSSIPGWCYAPC